jgi:hypothetical protein
MRRPGFALAVHAVVLGGCTSGGGGRPGQVVTTVYPASPTVEVEAACCDCVDAELSEATDPCTEAGGHCLPYGTMCPASGSQQCGAPFAVEGLYCCLSEIGNCGQPDATTYVCPASSDGGSNDSDSAFTCKGAAPAPIFPNFQDPGEAGYEDASFPMYCTATFPQCHFGRAPTCTCELLNPPMWICAY